MKLAFSSWGEGPRTAVLVHGITSNDKSWVNVAPALVEWGYRVIAVDLRGHGKSPRPEKGYTPHEMATDLAESVPVEPDLLLGHSLGGAVVLAAAAERLLRPRRLVLEDPAMASTREHLADAVSIREEMPRDVETLLARNPRWTRADAEAKAQAFADLSWDAMRAIAAAAPWDQRDLVGRLECPTLFVLADPSHLVSPADAARFEAILGPGSVATVAGAGHDIHREALPAFLDTLSSWLERVGR